MIKILLIVLLIVSSCVKTDVVGEPTTKSRYEKPKDTTIVLPPTDTSRVEITFNPIVEDWHDN